MKKFSLVVATLLISQSVMADDTKDWKLSGNLRAGFISDDGDSYEDEVHDLAVGGWITLTTPSVKGFTATGTVYTSQPLFGQNTDGWLTENIGDGATTGDSYLYLGEAYVTGTLFGKTAVVLGKKVIDTPFADSDDIGMTPNTFEVALVQNNDIENLTLLAGRVTKWSGMDAPKRGGFSDLTGGDGASVVAGIYNNDEIGVSGQTWYYFLDNLVGKVDVGIAYLDGTYSTKVNEQTTLSLSGQFAQFKQINGPENDGSVVGGQVEVGYDALTFGVAFNQADGDVAPTNGFGGGPFYTSSDILTIADAKNDSTAAKVYGSYDITDQISVSAGYLTMTPDKGDDMTELDLGASYAYNDNLSFDLYFEQTDFDDNLTDTEYKNKTDTEYSIYMNYKF